MKKLVILSEAKDLLFRRRIRKDKQGPRTKINSSSFAAAQDSLRSARDDMPPMRANAAELDR